jgi:hypothetical protein
VYDITEYHSLLPSNPTLNIFFYYYSKFLQIINKHFRNYTSIELEDEEDDAIYGTVINQLILQKSTHQAKINMATRRFTRALRQLKTNGSVYLPVSKVNPVQGNGTSPTTYAYIDLDKDENIYERMTNKSKRKLYLTKGTKKKIGVPFFCQVTVKIDIRNINVFIIELLKDLNNTKQQHYIDCQNQIIQAFSALNSFQVSYNNENLLLIDYIRAILAFNNVVLDKETITKNIITVTSMLIPYFSFNLYDRFVMIQRAYEFIAEAINEETEEFDLNELNLYRLELKTANPRNDFALRHLEADVLKNIAYMTGSLFNVAGNVAQQYLLDLGYAVLDILYQALISDHNPLIQDGEIISPQPRNDINIQSALGIMAGNQDCVNLLARSNLQIGVLPIEGHNNTSIFVNKEKFFKMRNFEDGDIQLATEHQYLPDEKTKLKRSQVRYFEFNGSLELNEVLIELRGIGKELNNDRYSDTIREYYNSIQKLNSFVPYMQQYQV